MKYLPTIFTRAIVALTISTIVLTPVAAHAQVGEVPATTNPIHGFSSLLSKDVIKNYILDVAARIIAGGIVRNLSNHVVGWIQGNHGKDVGFVTNLRQELRTTGDQAGAEFLNGVSKLNLCGNISPFLNINLQYSTSQRRQFSCTITGIRGNVKNFYQNFRSGGWSSFIQVSMEPQNDPFSALVIGYDAKLKAESEAQQTKEKTLLSNRGFLGFQVTETNCQPNSNPYDPNEETDDYEGWEKAYPTPESRKICHTEHKTQTPGGVIADTLSKAVGSGFDFTVVADAINEAIASVANALISKLISGSFSSGTASSGGTSISGEGLLNNELSTLPVDTNDFISTPIFKEAESALMGAASAIDELNTNLRIAARELAATRSDINALIASSDPILQQQNTARLEELRKKAANDETSMAQLSQQKKQILIGEQQLSGFIQGALGNADARQLTDAAEQLPTILENFKNVISVALPEPSNDIKANISIIIQGAGRNLRGETGAIDSLLTEIDALPTAPAGNTLAVAKRTEITGKRSAVLLQKSPIDTAQSQLAALSNNISTATTQAQINTRINEALVGISSDSRLIETTHEAVTTTRQLIQEYWALRE